MRHNKRQSARISAGMTLIEVLLVVVIMGIIAAVVLPQFTDTTEDALDAQLLHQLSVIRSQIQLYKLEHNGKLPGGMELVAYLQLVLYTNEDGDISESPGEAYPLGPYFARGVLINPHSEGEWFKFSNDPASETPDHTLKSGSNPVGWFYDPATGRISANSEGTTSDGTPRVEL